MEVTINGKKTDIPEGTTLAGFVARKGLNPETVVLEANGSIVGREAWEATALAPGDTLEVVSFVGGG